MKRFFTKEVKIALIAIIGISILYGGMMFLKGQSIFSPGNTYYMVFSDVSGLSASTPIFADGYKVGVVKKINYDYNQQKDILVEVRLNDDLRIPKGSFAEIESDFMGNVKVNLLLANNPRERLDEGEIIPGNINKGAMGKLSGIVPDVQRMIPKLDSILINLNLLLANPALQQSLNNMEETTTHLTASSKQLEKLMMTLNKSLPSVINKADGVMANTQTLTHNLAAVDIASTMKEVNATVANMKELTEKLNSDQGTLGLLMRDDKLYHNLNATVNSADSLLTNIKAHPKRYVHFSIFGRKDK